MSKPIAVIPTYVSAPNHVPLLRECLRTLRETSDCEILIVDDVSPMNGAAKIIDGMAKEYGAEWVQKKENSGFSRTVNVGLRLAHVEKVPAVLVNMDIQFIKPGWLEAALADPADVVGAKLLYPTLLIQHAGIYFSILHNYFDHMFRLAPANLEEACKRYECPVTGALQIIKPHVFDQIGYYDEDYRLSYEDVDFCLRVFSAGLTCAMNPNVVAIHHEGMVRMKTQNEKMKRWIDESHALLAQKQSGANLQRFTLPLDRGDRRNEAVYSMSGGV